MYIRTSIACTVTVSVYRTVNEPIQQHTAVHYNIGLRCDCDEPPSPKKLLLVSILQMSDTLSEAKCSRFLVAVLHSAECVEVI